MRYRVLKRQTELSTVFRAQRLRGIWPLRFWDDVQQTDVGYYDSMYEPTQYNSREEARAAIRNHILSGSSVEDPDTGWQQDSPP